MDERSIAILLTVVIAFLFALIVDYYRAREIRKITERISRYPGSAPNSRKIDPSLSEHKIYAGPFTRTAKRKLRRALGKH